jgi:hypothetical protein
MNPTEVNRITAARVVGDHTVELTFSDGFSGRLCLAPKLSGPIFGPLADPVYFQQFHLEDDTIRWPNDADFCPDVLRYWCELGKITSQEETDAYFTQSLIERAAS